jgi:hypothetical protein
VTVADGLSGRREAAQLLLSVQAAEITEPVRGDEPSGWIDQNRGQGGRVTRLASGSSRSRVAHCSERREPDNA